MPIVSSQGTVVVFDHDLICFKHFLPRELPLHCELVEPQCSSAGLISSGLLSGVEVSFANAFGNDYFLKKGGLYLCAEGAGSSEVTFSRELPYIWETFSFIESLDLGSLSIYVSEIMEGRGLQAYQIGDFVKAERYFESAVANNPLAVKSCYYLQLIVDRSHPVRMRTPPAVLWLCNQNGLWEKAWLNHIFSLSELKTVDVDEVRAVPRRLVVVDNALSLATSQLFQELFLSGCRICLVHLSDEYFVQDTSAYNWCDVVWRNYWSPLLACNKKVNFFALGYKSGFTSQKMQSEQDKRSFIWSFAGQTNKSTRPEMIKMMSLVDRGHVHSTSSFGAVDALDVVSYRKILDQTLFAPCPSGFQNLDSFRVSEALEAGCIPILERRPRFDYFSKLFPLHPMPTVASWSEVVELVRILILSKRIEALQQECGGWWKRYKTTLKTDFKTNLDNL